MSLGMKFKSNQHKIDLITKKIFKLRNGMKLEVVEYRNLYLNRRQERRKGEANRKDGNEN